MCFESYAVGQVKQIFKTNCNTYVLVGLDEFCRCEIVEGDKVFIVNLTGTTVEDIVEYVDVENKIINLTKTGEVSIYTMIFIGRE